jgi:hypothetical protein
VVNVKTLNGSEHDGRDLLNDDMHFMLSQVAENIYFFLLKNGGVETYICDKLNSFRRDIALNLSDVLPIKDVEENNIINITS